MTTTPHDGRGTAPGEKVISWRGPREGVAPRDRLQRPLHDLRISVMDRCNFRCPYCMPEDKYHKDFQFLKSSERLSFEEILRLAQVFAGLGVRKLRITGGEPLLRPNLPDLVGDLSRIEGVEDVALTTNGVLLAQHAAALKAAGLARVTVSLDSLDDAVFVAMNGGRGSRERVLEGIREAISAGLTPLKINTVVIRGVNDGTVLDLVERFRGTGVIVRFIEYMDVGTINHWRRADTVPSAELVRRIGERWPLAPVDRNYRGEVASRYAFADGQGEVGFISSVTEPFCGACTRARLSSDGQLFTCLFASKGTDLKGPLRAGATDAELRDLVAATWAAREDRYSELRAGLTAESGKVEMYYIGGLGMAEGSRINVPVRRMAGGESRDDTDWVAVEEPLELRVAFAGGESRTEAVGESLVVTMRTPGHDEELARGFLFAEGLVDQPGDVLEFVVGDPAEGNQNILQVTVREALRERFARARRSFYANSSCGICGKASIEALRARARFEVRGDALRLGAATLAALPAALAARQPTFAATGGLHAAALVGPDGAILDVREDVGRHNAVDKLVGAALRDGRLPLSNLALLVSGRASFEIIEKARMAGCPLVVAVGAPSSLAIDAAWESGITLVGFLRDGRFNVYASPGRVIAG